MLRNKFLEHSDWFTRNIIWNQVIHKNLYVENSIIGIFTLILHTNNSYRDVLKYFNSDMPSFFISDLLL